MRDTRQDQQHRTSDTTFSRYEATTLNLQPFEAWIEDWQVKLAELEARRAMRIL
jgi:hypothetical protein